MSKQRSFRPRSKLSFSEEEEGKQQDVVIKPSTAAGGAAAAPSGAQPAKPAGLNKQHNSKPNLLSFDDDGGAADMPSGPVQGKKRDKDRSKGKLGRAQGLPDLPSVATVPQTSAGEYTAERIKELQKNALSFSAAKFAVQDADGVPAPAAAAAPAPLIKLSGSFKPAGAPKDDRFTINPTALVQEKKPAPPKSPSPSPATIKTASETQPAVPSTAAADVDMPGPDEEEEEDGPAIPDDDTIRLAKAKRERLRQAHLAPDYVPLGGASRLLAGSKAGSKTSEYAGDAAEVGSGSDAEAELEDVMRLKFSVKGDAPKADRKGYAKSLELSPEDDEQAFAEEQLRKAVRRNQSAMPHSASAPTTTTAYSTMQYGSNPQAQQYTSTAYNAVTAYTGTDPAEASYYQAATTTAVTPGVATMHTVSVMVPSGKAAGALARSRMEAILQASSGVVASLREGVAALTASHKAAQGNLKKTSNLLTQSLARIETLEQDSKAASEKYVYVQQFRSYIADLVDCLTHKSAVVEALEDSLMELREERAAAARATVQGLEDEMLRPAQAAVGAALGVLGRGGALPAAQQAADNAADAEEEAMEDEGAGPEELDEFGRNVNIETRREAQERRRQRTLAVKQEIAYLKAAATGAQSDKAESSWEVETDAQASRYTDRHREIMELAATVFADAGEEFASLQPVKARLEEFKAKYPRDYSNMYMHLSCPALFSPYVRLELLHWDPLYADQRPDSDNQGQGVVANGTDATSEVHKGFDKQAWYNGLFDYGMGAEPAADDPDMDLVPQLVRKLVLPLATHMLVKCWDPASPQQSKAAAAIVEDLLVYVPAEAEGMSELLDSVVSVLTTAVERVSLPPWPAQALAAAPIAEAVLSRRFRSAVRLLRGLGSWERVLSRTMLLKLALEKVVKQQLMHYLRSAAVGAAMQPHTAVTRLGAVADALPVEWFAGGCPSEASSFVELLKSLASAFEARSDKAGLSAPGLRLCKVLQRVGEHQRAALLAGALGLML